MPLTSASLLLPRLLRGAPSRHIKDWEKSGHDPFAYFRDHPGRFRLWHLKDMARTEHRSVEFGQGKFDLKGLLQHARRAFESIQIDYDYLANLNY
jgi:hypothetical protein